MLSLDEIFSQPLPDLEGEFGFTTWPAPALASAPAPDPTACLEEPDQAALSPVEERRRRRRISNRESARRSRMRRQRHLEELLNQAGHLHSENQVLTNRLVDVVHRCLLLRRDNDRLRSEFTALSGRLSELRRLLVVRHLGFASTYEQTLASLIA